MYYLWCSRCHRQNSDSQRSAAGRQLLLEDSVLLHISEEEILAGSRWAVCRDILMLFFVCYFSFLRLAGWRKKCMDSITSPGKHASPSQRCVYSPATSWPEESFSDCWAAHLQEIVLEALTFWTALSTFLHTFHAKRCGCLYLLTFWRGHDWVCGADKQLRWWWWLEGLVVGGKMAREKLSLK